MYCWGMAVARWEGGELILVIHAQPGARRTEAAGLHGEALKIRLAAQAIEGAANAELLSFLAESFSVARRDVELIAGAQGRQKRARVRGADRACVEAMLRSWGVQLA
jgi:uncharacterized protein (TIGR00251 family)